MARTNTPRARVTGRSPLITTTAPDTTTYEGAPAYSFTAQSELFQLGVVNFAGEGSFYEAADERDARFVRLIAQNTGADPVWTAAFLRWLRTDGNIRTASIIGGVEFGRAVNSLGACPCNVGLPLRYWSKGVWQCAACTVPGDVEISPRKVLASVLQRADEPGEALAYYATQYGRPFPSWLKRGIGDAVLRLYTERSVIKWDSAERGFRFGDVIDLVRPGDSPSAAQHVDAPWRHALFTYALDRRHNRANPRMDGLPLLQRRAELLALPVAERRSTMLADPEVLLDAGFTWESLAGWLQGPMDADAWHSIIPGMGVMALARNLRNFDEAGVNAASAAFVNTKLTDPNEIARSRMFPYRWLSAYIAAPSDRWKVALGTALDLSTQAVPQLSGRTLVCVDVSASMDANVSDKSAVRRWQVGALFGYVLAARSGGNVDLVAFATNSDRVNVARGGSVLRGVERFGIEHMRGRLGHGTNTATAVRTHFNGHDRVVVVTDDQPRDGNPGSYVPAEVPLYTINLAGYDRGASPSGVRNRHQIAGFTDAVFSTMDSIERAQSGRWPWMESTGE